MRIRMAIPDRHIDADVLNAALEATTRANERMLASGEAPLIEHAIRRGVRWRPEPPGPEHFDLSADVAHRGWGDCDDLAPWHAAGLRLTGRDPEARAIVRRSGPQRWHAVVERSNGAIDDPSRWAGMGRRAGVHGAVVPHMVAPGGGVVAVRPWGGRWAGRCDLPWGDSAHSLSALSSGPTMLHAFGNALAGACIVGDAAGTVDPEFIARAMGVDAALCGHSGDEVRQALLDRGIETDSIEGSFFDSITSAIAPIAKAAVPIAASFVPGGSLVAPLATGLIDKLSQGGGGGGGAAAAAPGAAAPAYAPGGGGNGRGPGGYAGGPIIIRF